MKSTMNPIQLSLLKRLLRFSDQYEISIQFWPEQTVVFISKDGVDLIDYGGSINFALNSALDYLNRITFYKK